MSDIETARALKDLCEAFHAAAYERSADDHSLVLCAAALFLAQLAEDADFKAQDLHELIDGMRQDIRAAA